MEPITIERVGQELRAQYINSQKRKEKISASIILLKYYVKQQCRNTLKHTMHIWKHNCTKIKCSIAKTSNTMYNSSIMNDILRKKMEKKQDNIVKERMEKRQRNIRFKAFLFRTKRIYRKRIKESSEKRNKKPPSSRFQKSQRGGRLKIRSNYFTRQLQGNEFQGSKSSDEFRLDLLFPDVYMKKMKIKAKVKIQSVINLKTLLKWVDNLFVHNSHVKRGRLFELFVFTNEDIQTKPKHENIVKKFTDEIINHEDIALNKSETSFLNFITKLHEWIHTGYCFSFSFSLTTVP